MSAVIESYTSKPFKWGSTDCCSFVCDYVQEQTGIDLSAGFAWHDYETATDLVASYGSLSKLITHELGPPCNTLDDGNICLTVHRGEQLVGVIAGQQALFRTKTGLVKWPLNRVWTTWSVF